MARKTVWNIAARFATAFFLAKAPGMGLGSRKTGVHEPHIKPLQKPSVGF
jgi:hypothetical protein